MAREAVRKCPYCPKEHPSRGLTSHVKWADSGGHGPRGKLPPGFNAKDCTVVGWTEIDMDRAPVQPEHDRYFCKYCENAVSKGKRGLAIHVGRADDELHAGITAEDVNPSEHTRFPATKDKKILVPSDAYKLVVELDKEEKDDGWEIVVDESLSSSIEVSDVMATLRQYYTQKTMSGEDTDPVEAYNYIREKLLSNEKTDDDGHQSRLITK